MKVFKGICSVLFIIGCIVAVLRNNDIANFFYNQVNSDAELETLIDNASHAADGTNSTQETKKNELEEAIILRVVDGDTVIVTTSDGTEKKIRLIGVDCPESVNPDESKNTEEGNVASEYTKEHLEQGTTVYLQYDQETDDVHGRTLAYLWLSASVDVNNENDIIDYMYNAKLIMNDVADPKVFLPNNKYAELFEKLKDLREEIKAKNNET